MFYRILYIYLYMSNKKQNNKMEINNLDYIAKENNSQIKELLNMIKEDLKTSVKKVSGITYTSLKDFGTAILNKENQDIIGATIYAGFESSNVFKAMSIDEIIEQSKTKKIKVINVYYFGNDRLKK